MALTSFKDFIDNIIVESLHPELQTIVSAPSTSYNKKKQQLLSKKIQDLTQRGEITGIEGNMPEGSSRAYLKHSDPHIAMVDGVPSAILSEQKWQSKQHWTDTMMQKLWGLSLGRLQNQAENNDGFVNSQYRVLTNNGDNSFSTNENGIFPPLVDHDPNHEWSMVGHSRDIKPGEFRKLTKTDTHPKGISHREFVNALERDYNRSNGRYWKKSDKDEADLDHIQSHPLVQKFLDHQWNTHTPPYDYRQRKNMGIFEHPNGTKSIVARDHGFSSEVQNAYKDARENMYNRR